AIWLLSNVKEHKTDCYSTRYNRWPVEFRNFLFLTLVYTPISHTRITSRTPKSPGLIADSIFKKCLVKSNGKILLAALDSKGGPYSLFYFRAVLYWLKVLTEPPVFQEDGVNKRTGEMKEIKFADSKTRDAIVALLSSNLYSFYYTVWSSCQVVNSSDFYFPVDVPLLVKERGHSFSRFTKTLIEGYQANSIIKERHYSAKGRTFVMHKQYFFLKKSKHIIDNIDRILSEHYGFSDEELDFIINYDIKYRMGQNASDGTK
ncbi:MAG: hypothetical protein JRJ85_20785, partial [Deltaproteobacteria bacterium]|nr:hypothetical protein [Deltaproteobacteria bacterium]